MIIYLETATRGVCTNNRMISSVINDKLDEW